MTERNHETFQRIQHKLAEFINDNPVAYYGAKAAYLFFVILFFFGSFLKISDLKHFLKKSRTGFKLASWYEIFDSVIFFFENGKFEASDFFFNNPHFRLSWIMGSMSSYKAPCYTLTLCYFLFYLRYISFCLSNILKQYQELSKSLKKFSEEQSLNTFLGYLEIIAFFELFLWKLFSPFSASKAYVFYSYYFIIISYSYVHSKLHQYVWSRISSIIKNTISKTSISSILSPIVQILFEKISNFTTFISLSL